MTDMEKLMKRYDLFPKDNDSLAMRVRDIIWVDYCDCDCDKADAVDSVTTESTYDKIRYYPFEIVHMLLDVIDAKDREISNLTCQVSTSNAVLGAIHKRIGEVLDERR